mmetsp:Transcript_2647/g.4616  ORF Transcript_2647/g.4616 Transcript_2647/m.4616 type:complete len:273 (-) Transcript_2647:1219-2037(-)
MASISKNNRMLYYINYRMRVGIDDGRILVGTLIAFDKHMNLVLSDCEEFRKLRKKTKKTKKNEEAMDDGEEKKKEEVDTAQQSSPQQDEEKRRVLGLVVLRGECVTSLSIVSAPPKVDKRKSASAIEASKAAAASTSVMPLGDMVGFAPTGFMVPGSSMGPAQVPIGLSGVPVHGIGAGSSLPVPQVSAMPQMYAQQPQPPMMAYGRGMPISMPPPGMPQLGGSGVPPPPPGFPMGPPPGFGRGMPIPPGGRGMSQPPYSRGGRGGRGGGFS